MKSRERRKKNWVWIVVTAGVSHASTVRGISKSPCTTTLRFSAPEELKRGYDITGSEFSPQSWTAETKIECPVPLSYHTANVSYLGFSVLWSFQADPPTPMSLDPACKHRSLCAVLLPHKYSLFLHICWSRERLHLGKVKSIFYEEKSLVC